MSQTLLSLDQAAAWPGVQVSRESLLYHVHRGRLRAKRVGKKIWVVALPDLLRFNATYTPQRRHLNQHKFPKKEVAA
jgi:hypothetical protein